MVKELFEVMENLNESLEQLLVVSQNKRRAIVQREIAELEESIKMEEKLLNEIKQLEKRRMEILKSFLQDGSALGKEKVEQIMERISEELPEKLKEHLYYLRNKIKEVSQRIKSVNQQNMFLIESSREMLRMIFAELKGNRDSLIVNRKV